MADPRIPVINQLVVIERLRPDGLTTPLGRAVVVRVAPNQIEFDVPDGNVNLGLLRPGLGIVVQFWNDLGIYRAHTSVVRVHADRLRRLTVETPERVETQQRRAYFRVDVRVPLSFRRGMPEDLMSETPYAPTFTKDLSGGGLRFETDEPISIGDPLELLVELPELPSPLAVLGVVVRKAPTRKQGTNAIGAHFVTIHETARDKLIAFLFREQGRQARKNG